MTSIITGYLWKSIILQNSFVLDNFALLKLYESLKFISNVNSSIELTIMDMTANGYDDAPDNGNIDRGATCSFAIFYEQYQNL